jgi:hypothetical protein
MSLADIVARDAAFAKQVAAGDLFLQTEAEGATDRHNLLALLRETRDALSALVYVVDSEFEPEVADADRALLARLAALDEPTP